MYKFIPLLALFFAGAALAQQVDVSGKDFLSGAGDAKLAGIAQQAAAAGKSLEVTAPDYWQAKVAAKLHAGAADVAVKSNNGFFENVLVKIVDAAPAKAAAPTPDAQAEKAAADKVAAQKAAGEKAAQEKAAAEKAAAERAAAQAAAAKAAADKAAAEKAAAEKAAAEKAAADKAAAEKAAAEKAAAEKAAAEKAAADKREAARNAMLKNLNEGRPAEGDLEVGKLQVGDVVYVDGDLRGVVRRGSSRLQFYWLQGDLNLDRVELSPNGEGRYKVLRTIDPSATPVLRTRSGGTLSAAVPADGSAARKALQDQYAEGRVIADSLKPSDLRQGDTIYTGQGAALVVRRAGGQLARYWLDGSLDLGQIGIKSQGGNVYKVLSDTIK
jgi:nucleoid-associated protein YgaU